LIFLGSELLAALLQRPALGVEFEQAVDVRVDLLQAGGSAVALGVLADVLQVNHVESSLLAGASRH
jgi:hypothetical protein